MALTSLCTETYEMINSCDPGLAGWTADGTMFVVKDQDVFAKEVIPKFFEHNKFTSFARQLNFYGFRKMQVRTRNSHCQHSHSLNSFTLQQTY